MIYIVPIFVVTAVYLIFGRIEGFISESLMEYGGPPLQGLNRGAQYVILIWVFFIPLFVAYNLIYYFIIEKDMHILKNLIMQDIGLFILAGFLEDWAVFAFSPVLTLKDPGSVFVNVWGVPTFNFFGNPVPIVYPIFLFFAVLFNIIAMRDYIIPGASSFLRKFPDINNLVTELERRSKQLIIEPAKCEKCGFNAGKITKPLECQECGELINPPPFKIV